MWIYCYGVYMADIALNLSTIIKNLGMRVLIVDRTKYLQVVSCIPWIDNPVNITQYKEIDYAVDYPNMQDCYDVIFMLEDFIVRPIMEDLNNIKLICFSDYNKYHMLALEKTLAALSHPATVILRNEVDGRIDQGYFNQKGLFDKYKSIQVYSLSLEQRNMEISLLMEYDFPTKLKAFSKEYQLLLKELILNWFPSITEKLFWKSIKSQGGLK